jgi:hypothetical protein
MPKVVKISDEIPGAIRVDRQSCWGNPFVLGVDGDRNEVCNMFEEYARWRHQFQPTWLEPLKGKDLACHCAPKRCHGDTLLRLANENN